MRVRVRSALLIFFLVCIIGTPSAYGQEESAEKEKYFQLWQNYAIGILGKDYYEKHIKIKSTSFYEPITFADIIGENLEDKGNPSGRVFFGIEYEFVIDWLRIPLIDQFLIENKKENKKFSPEEISDALKGDEITPVAKWFKNFVTLHFSNLKDKPENLRSIDYYLSKVNQKCNSELVVNEKDCNAEIGQSINLNCRVQDRTIRHKCLYSILDLANEEISCTVSECWPQVPLETKN